MCYLEVHLFVFLNALLEPRMAELSEFKIIFLYCLIVSLSDGVINELENLENVICEETLHPSSDDKNFVKIWGRLLSILKDIYELMNSGDSQGYVLAKHLFATGGPPCLKTILGIKELKDRYNLSYDRTDFLYGLVKSTQLAYTLVELKYNMTDFENYKKSLYYPGNDKIFPANPNQTYENVVNNFANQALGPEEEEIKQRNDCVPDFAV